MVDKERLVQLLEKAMVHVVKKPAVREEATGTPYERQLGAFSKVPDFIRAGLTDILAQNPDLQVFNDRLFHTGFGAVRVTYEQLAQWLVYRASEIGPENTVDDLQKYCEMRGTPTYQVLAISGIEVEKKLELPNGITLVPFTCAPESWVKNELIRQGSIRKQAMAAFLPPSKEDKPVSPSAALVRKISISPKSFKQGENGAWPTKATQDLYEVCECLTLVGRSAPVQAGFWGQLEDWVPCGTIPGGGTFAPPFSGTVFEGNYRFGNADYTLAKNIVSEYIALDESVRKALTVPLRRLNLSRRRQNLVDKAIDIGIALEALLVYDLSSNDPISFPLRLRGAWLLGRRAASREQYLQLFKSIYECRCRAVHTGQFRPKFTKKLPLPLNDLLKKGEDLCADMIKDVLEKGKFPEWEKLILGGSVSNTHYPPKSRGFGNVNSP